MGARLEVRGERPQEGSLGTVANWGMVGSEGAKPCSVRGQGNAQFSLQLLIHFFFFFFFFSYKLVTNRLTIRAFFNRD